MGGGLKVFLSQRKIEDPCFLGINIFRVFSFLFSAPNIGEDLFFWKYIFQKGIFCPVLKSLQGAANSLEASATNRHTSTPMSTQTYLSFALVDNFYQLVQLL